MLITLIFNITLGLNFKTLSKFVMANSINKSVQIPKKITKKNLEKSKINLQKISKINEKENKGKEKRILILSWEMFPLYAGGLGFLTKSVVDEMKKQNCFVQVLCPFIPKNITVEAINLEKRIKFWCKKNKNIPNLDFPLDNFGQKKTNHANWPTLFSDKRVKNNKKINLYPQNTPAITKSFGWSVLEFLQNNESFDLIIGMDWETIPTFYILEDYFNPKENIVLEDLQSQKEESNTEKGKIDKKYEEIITKNSGSKTFQGEITNVESKPTKKTQNQSVNQNLHQSISKKIDSNIDKKSLNNTKIITKIPFYFYINATELDRGPEQINQICSKNAILKLEKETYKNAFKIISISDITKDILIKHYQVKPEKILTVYNDIEFVPSLEKFNYLKQDKTVLFIGRLEAQKGLIFLVETAARVLEIDSSIKFLVAGDGDSMPNLVETICEKGLEKSFFLTGWLGEDAKKKLYNSSDLFVMPSPSEPFGLTPLEAIRSGTAVISSQTCGFLSVIPSTPTFAYHDINNFAQLIIYYLQNPLERAKLLQTQQEELAKHSWSNEIKKILDTLEQGYGS